MYLFLYLFKRKKLYYWHINIHPQNFENRNKSCHRLYRSVANFLFVVAFAYIGKINSLYVLRIGCEKKRVHSRI